MIGISPGDGARGFMIVCCIFGSGWFFKSANGSFFLNKSRIATVSALFKVK